MELNEEKAKEIMKGKNWGIKALVALVAATWLVIELILTSGCAVNHKVGFIMKSTPNRDTMSITIQEQGRFKR